MITLLKLEITEEDTFRGFGRELVLPRSKDMEKKTDNQDKRGNAKERLARKNDGMRDLIM